MLNQKHFQIIEKHFKLYRDGESLYEKMLLLDSLEHVTTLWFPPLPIQALWRARRDPEGKRLHMLFYLDLSKSLNAEGARTIEDIRLLPTVHRVSLEDISIFPTYS